MDNPEKTDYKTKKNKTKTQHRYVLDTTIRKQTNKKT